MTPAQKAIVKKLLEGCYLMKWRLHSTGKPNYRLFDKNGNPIGKYNERTVRKIDNYWEGKVFKTDKHKRITLNLSVVRQVDGRRSIKRLYKKANKLKKISNI